MAKWMAESREKASTRIRPWSWSRTTSRSRTAQELNSETSKGTDGFRNGPDASWKRRCRCVETARRVWLDVHMLAAALGSVKQTAVRLAWLSRCRIPSLACLVRLLCHNRQCRLGLVGWAKCPAARATSNVEPTAMLTGTAWLVSLLSNSIRLLLGKA